MHWKVGRLLPAQDTVGVGGRLPVLVGQIRPVRHQAAVGDEEPEGVHRGQAVPDSHRDDQRAIAFVDGVWQHDQAAIGLACKLFDALLDLGSIARIGRRDLHVERWRRRFDGTPHPLLRLLLGIANDRHARDLRRDSLSSSSDFPYLSNSPGAKPVMLPPGRARLATKPLPTGSVIWAKMIGMLRVSCCSGCNASAVLTRMTSGSRLTSSFAWARMRAGSALPQR